MDVRIDKDTGILQSFTIDLSADEVREKVRGKIRSVNAKLRIPGYRPGHVPESVVRRNKDLLDSIHKEVLEDLLDSAYSDLIRKASGTVVHLQPAPVSIDSRSEEDGVRVSGEMEVFQVPEGAKPFGVTLSPEEELSVADEEIAQEIERLKVMLSNQFREDLPSDAPVEMSDFVRFRIHLEHPESGETFDSEQVSEVGGDQVPDAFTQALLGKKVGDRVTATLPLNIPSEGEKGTRMEVHPAELSILEIQRRIPLTTEELVQRVFSGEDGSTDKTVEDLKADVAKGLLGQKVLRVLDKKRKELRREVLASWGIPIPEKRLSREFARLGIRNDVDREEYRQIFLWHLVLDDLVAREKIEPDWDVLSQEYREILRSQGKSPSQTVDRDALSAATQNARRVKIEEMMLREAQFGASELYFGTGGYLEKAGMGRFGKRAPVRPSSSGAATQEESPKAADSND
jgi:trigger factor